MPLQETSGAASYDAFGGGVPVAAKYIEDYFQSWLRTGTGASATVTTGLNGSINETMVWTKSRSAATTHKLTDNVRGATKALSSNTTGAEVTDSQGLTAFSSTGYTIGTNTNYNNSGATYVDWQFVSTPKFFDVVAGLTSDSNGNLPAFNHSLASVPGCVFLKATNSGSNWVVFHRGLLGDGANQYIQLNLTNAATNATGFAVATSTTFQVAAGSALVPNVTYVAYLFAHNAGGFGLTGNDNVISCGSVTVTSGSGITNVNLGYEPQWLLVKIINQSGYNWAIYDTMRGWVVTTGANNNARLNPNTSNTETSDQQFQPNATGFQCNNSAVYPGSSTEIIYIAIRRGPMKVPTDGTKVFAPALGNGGNPSLISGFPVDFAMQKPKSGGGSLVGDRLRGAKMLIANTTDAEVDNSFFKFDYMNGWSSFANSSNIIGWMFRRAPGFFDEVCYTGTGSARTVAHNLTVVPELMIVKCRSAAALWLVYSSATGSNYFSLLNTTAAKAEDAAVWNNTTPTASVFSLGNAWVEANQSGQTYVNYLFATCPGVSKVGSYTGTGATQVINCGFTGGARFVLIKRTDSTGDWYVWDSARGIVAGNDPYLLLNSTAAEVTNTDFVDTAATGFEISSTAPAGINANGGTFIFLAIA